MCRAQLRVIFAPSSPAPSLAALSIAPAQCPAVCVDVRFRGGAVAATQRVELIPASYVDRKKVTSERGSAMIEEIHKPACEAQLA
jgi:hypothetical protein